MNIRNILIIIIIIFAAITASFIAMTARMDYPAGSSRLPEASSPRPPIVMHNTPPSRVTEGFSYTNISGEYAVVDVFFGTDRNPIWLDDNTEFGSSRAELSYGVCQVSIPFDHRLGVLESPMWWRFEFNENPTKHVVLQRSSPLTKTLFFSFIKSKIERSERKKAFIFVHGYNVSFEDAARRTAQISYDLEFDGVPVFYSWPSQGETAKYTIDEQNIEWSQANLQNFLTQFFLESDADDIYLIGHSMGNRALTRAVMALFAEDPANRGRLKEIILTAPDIDADVFKRDIAPVLAASGKPVTLYASSKDRALTASKMVHGYARAGDSGGGLVVVPGIETIDATQVDTDLMGHSYFAENRSVISDIYYLIHTGERAGRRFGLETLRSSAGDHWRFKE